jgi:hypothetical protein
MQALSDELQLDRLEKKVDDGFAETKAEFRAVRAEMRAEIGAVHRSLHTMWLTMILGFAGMSPAVILGFAGILLQHL